MSANDKTRKVLRDTPNLIGGWKQSQLCMHAVLISLLQISTSAHFLCAQITHKSCTNSRTNRTQIKHESRTSSHKVAHMFAQSCVIPLRSLSFINTCNSCFARDCTPFEHKFCLQKDYTLIQKLARNSINI